MRATTFRCLALAAGLAVCALAAAGDDPPPERLERKSRPPEAKQPEPPAKLEKKPQPPEPGAKDKAGDAKGKDEQPKRLKRPDDDADRGPPEDPEKLKEQITKDMQAAERKLKELDPGADTQQHQDRALKNLDKLLDQARNPPPSDQQQQQQQSKGKSSGKGKGKGQQQQLSRSEQRRQRRQQMQLSRNQQGQRRPGQQDQDQMAQNQQNDQQRDPRFGGGNTPRGKGEPPKEGIKDIWGHLPESLRQEVDHYYRTRFMPKYQELLQQYYNRLAEQDKRVREDR